MSKAPPSCQFLAMLLGRSVAVLDRSGRVLDAAGPDVLDLPKQIGNEVDLRRMASSSTATPATWDIGAGRYRVFGMRWPADDVRILVRIVPVEASGFTHVAEKFAALEARELAVRDALDRALEAEAASARNLVELQRINEELERYAALVAHDLRAPLRTARLLADRAGAILSEGGVVETVVDLHTRLGETLGRLDDVVLRLLEYSRIRDQSLEITALDCKTLIETAVADLWGNLRDAGGSLSVAAAGSVTGDGALLAVAIRELVLNAIKHRSQERTLEISVSACVDGDRVSIRIRDNGVGIPPGERARAFEMFSRLRSDGEGLGFGLTYCKQIVEVHGGSISLEHPTNGPGTEVCVVLPVGVPEPAQHDAFETRQASVLAG